MLMGDVFAKADSVCVWLGESDHDLHKDCQVIDSISDNYEQILGESDSKSWLGGERIASRPQI